MQTIIKLIFAMTQLQVFRKDDQVLNFPKLQELDYGLT